MSARQNTPSERKDKRLFDALAWIIGSTHRTSRKANLVEVADAIKTAEEILGSRRALAQRVGLSEEMLRQFASVNRLSGGVRRLVQRSRISSVDVCRKLATLPKGEQMTVARAYVDGVLTSKELRDVVSLRKANPSWAIRQCIERLSESRDSVEYVMRFRAPDEHLDASCYREKLEHVLGARNVIGLTLAGLVVTAVITRQGYQLLGEMAAKAGTSKRRLVLSLLETE